MAKISIVPWRGKKTRDGTVPLYLVIHHRSKRSTIALPVRIKEKDWNPLQKEIRKSNRHHARLNPYLKSIVMKAEDAILDAVVEGKDFSAAAIKRAVQGTADTETHDFLVDFQNRIQEFRDRGQHGSVDAYTPVLAKLKDYTLLANRSTVLHYDDLTVLTLLRFSGQLIKPTLRWFVG